MAASRIISRLLTKAAAEAARFLPGLSSVWLSIIALHANPFLNQGPLCGPANLLLQSQPGEQPGRFPNLRHPAKS
jgi:hypothetical protein